MALLAVSKSILIVGAFGHYGLPGNELADHQAKLSAADAQPDNTHDAAIQRVRIRRFCRAPPIQHVRLKEVHPFLHNEQIDTSFSKTERTDVVCLRSGHHPALRRCLHLVVVSVNALCRLCGDEVESVEHIWLRCPALLMEGHHRNLGHTMDKLVR